MQLYSAAEPLIWIIKDSAYLIPESIANFYQYFGKFDSVKEYVWEIKEIEPHELMETLYFDFNPNADNIFLIGISIVRNDDF